MPIFSISSALKGVSPYIAPVSSLLGLFGTAKNYNPASDPNYQAAQQQIGQEQAIGNQYGNNAATASAAFGNFNPQYNTAVQNEANYLQQNPYTDQQSASVLANAMNGADNAYNRANANLTANLASRGITDGSELAGGLAQNATNFAGQQAAAQNSLAQQEIQQANRDRNALVSLLGGAANTAFRQEDQSLGAEDGVNKAVYGQYMGQANNDQNIAAGAANARLNALTNIGAGALSSGSGSGTVRRRLPTKPISINQVLGRGSAGQQSAIGD